MTDNGWGAESDPKKVVAEYFKAVKAAKTKMVKLQMEIAAIVAARPIGELLKCTDAAALGFLQRELRELTDVADEAYKSAGNGLDAIRRNVLPQVMESLGIELLKVKGLGRIELAPDMFASQKKEGVILMPPQDDNGNDIIGELDADGNPTKADWDSVGVHEWLARIGAGDLVTDTVNASSLKALLRRRMKDGKDVPEALFAVTPFTYSKIVKA